MLTKIVNGVEVAMSPQEEAAIRAEWAANAAHVPVQAVLSQDLMAQFTVADFAAIRVAVATNDTFGLLWASLQTQKDPMLVTGPRFKAGWSALIQVLTQARMDAIATALGVTVTL